MTKYVVLIPGNETAWAQTTAEERAAVYQRHQEFAQLLAERGHTVVDGAELAPSAAAKTVRSRGGEVVVTDGPYAETVEQLSGFYLIESSDLDDLVRAVGHLAGAEGGLEVRECLGGGDG